MGSSTWMPLYVQVGQIERCGLQTALPCYLFPLSPETADQKNLWENSRRILRRETWTNALQ